MMTMPNALLSAPSIPYHALSSDLHPRVSAVHDYRMSNIVLDRIEERLEALEMKAETAVRMAGLSRGTISKMRAGTIETPTVWSLERLALVLQTDVAYLLGKQEAVKLVADGDAAPRVSLGMPILGKVEASRFFPVDDLDDQHERDVIEGPRHHRFPGAKHMAFQVTGDCMDALKPRPILDGDYVLCVGWFDTGYLLSDGMVVVVEQTLQGGHFRERTVKQVERREGGHALCPRSNNKNHREIFIPRGNNDSGRGAEVIGLVYHISAPVDVRF